MGSLEIAYTAQIAQVLHGALATITDARAADHAIFQNHTLPKIILREQKHCDYNPKMQLSHCVEACGNVIKSSTDLDTLTIPKPLRRSQQDLSHQFRFNELPSQILYDIRPRGHCCLGCGQIILASVQLGAGGKPSTWSPPGGLADLHNNQLSL